MKKISVHNAPSYTWGDQCLSYVLFEQAGLSVKEERMPPAASETLHYHQKAEQFFYVLGGTLTIYVDGQSEQLQPGEGRAVAAGQKHFVVNETNAGTQFLVISAPSTASDRWAAK